ncbi:MAG TPA: hypothetical protein VFF94_02385 [Novosphingobium sp.]|nr:hypothetical protein [Novosphingobium sp.]
MTHSLEILGKVKVLVERLAPTPVCAVCLAEKLEGVGLEAVGLAFHELAVARGFSLGNDSCSLCGEQRQTIRKHK